jgi:hypothetical protein
MSVGWMRAEVHLRDVVAVEADKRPDTCSL